MNNSIRIRKITDASVITAIYCIFFLISRLSGLMLEYYLFFLLPLPIAIYAYKYDVRSSWIPFFATTVISIFLTVNPLSSISYVVPGTLMGLLMGGVFAKKNIKPVYIVLLLSILSATSEFLSTYIIAKILGIEDIYYEITSIVNFIEDLTIKLGVSNFNKDLLQTLLVGLIPSIVLITALVDTLLAYFVFIIIITRIKKLREIENVRTNFNNMFIPWWIGIVYIAFVIITILLSNFFFYSNNSIARIMVMILINCSVIFTISLIYFGVKISALYFAKLKKPILIIIVYIFVIIFPILVSLLGLIDILFGLEKKLLDSNRELN